MTHPFSRAAAVALAALFTGTLMAETTPAPAPGAPTTNAAAATPRKKGLGGTMKTMGRALKKVKETVTDPAKQAETLAAVADLRASIETAQGMADKSLENIPPADHAKYKESYAKRMGVVAELAGKLEAAVKSGDVAGAQGLIKQLQQERTDGHDEFKVD